MFGLKLMLAFPIVLSQTLFAAAAAASPLARSEGVIAALLSTPKHARSDLSVGFIRRQSGCGGGDFLCSDGAHCCPIGYYCGEWGGQAGCCPLGKICGGSSPVCAHTGYVHCPGKDFCCAPSETCGQNTCLSGGGGTPPPHTTKAPPPPPPPPSTSRPAPPPPPTPKDPSPSRPPSATPSNPVLSSPVLSSPVLSDPATTPLTTVTQNTITSVPNLGTATGNLTPSPLAANGAISNSAIAAVITSIALWAGLMLIVT